MTTGNGWPAAATGLPGLKPNRVNTAHESRGAMSIVMPEQIASLLDPAAALAEQGFLAAGQSLERAVEILDRLTQRFTAYVARLTEGALDEASSGLTAASARIATLADSHQADLAALEPLARVVA